MPDAETRLSPLASTASEGTLTRLPDGVTIEDAERMNRLANEDRRPSTRRVYRSKWRVFTSWCDGRDVEPMPATPEHVGAYLSERAEAVSLSTVRQDVAAISWMHSRHGCDDPTRHAGVEPILDGISQTKRGERRAPKRAVLTNHIRAMVEAVRIDDPGADAGRVASNAHLRGLRDAALLLVGYAGAMRRSELAGITAVDVTFNERGMEIHLPKTKTEARTIGINEARNPTFCSVRALRSWMDAAGIVSGPIFRGVPRTMPVKQDAEATPITGQSVRNVVGRAAEAVGLDPDEVGGHSLRRGHITQGALNGATVDRLMRQAGHADPRTTTTYVEDAKRMETNTSQDLGL